jgi:ubiquinone/menaquinone biosynthesis C-methylase UbiE
MKFLDVVTGSGALSIPAAYLGAEVVAIDISPVMIERLILRASEERLSNLKGYVMDAHRLDLTDDTFDIAASMYGVMLLPDLPRAMRELVRVTKPDGRVLVISFGPPTVVEFLSFFLGAMKSVLLGFKGLPMDPPPLPFQVADPGKLRLEMVRAELKDIEVKTVTEKLELKSSSHLWD